MAKNRNKAILEVGKSTYSEMNMSNYLVKIVKFSEILPVSGINHIYYSINLLNTTLG